jgi:signal transduction histidine kinase
MRFSSGTKLFGFLDFAAIFTAFSYYAAVNAKTLKRIKTKALGFAGFIAISVGTLYFFNFLREILFASFVIGLLFSEYRILKSQGKSFFIISNKKVLITFGIGIIFLVLDSKKIVCDPNNHYFQMHALWHICDAVSLFFLTRHLDQHRS